MLVLLLSSCSAFTNSKDDVKAKIADDASKETAAPIVCGSGTGLNQQTNQCVPINNGNPATNTQPSANTPSVPPSQLIAPPATGITCREPSGVFTQLYYRQRNFVSGFLCGDACKADVLGMFRYQGNCPADIYIEAGIPNAIQSVAPLSIVPSGYFGATKGSPSACDGNTHFNGVVFKQVQPNQVLVFELQPENYGVEGTYSIGIGAYTGCFKDGGKAVQALTKSYLIGFSNNYQRSTGYLNKDIDLSWVQIV